MIRTSASASRRVGLFMIRTSASASHRVGLSSGRRRAGPARALPVAAAILSLHAFVPGGAYAQSPAAAAAASLHDLAFMTGCWQGPDGDGGIIEEYYSTPSDNLIVGTTRYVAAGRATGFEFSRIGRAAAGIELLPYPGGRPSEHAFLLTRLDERGAVFEAPEHDFPKRILYLRQPDGSRIARIDGGEGSDQAMEWRLEPVACGAERG